MKTFMAAKMGLSQLADGGQNAPQKVPRRPRSALAMAEHARTNGTAAGGTPKTCSMPCRVAFAMNQTLWRIRETRAR
jgi:hypothetical protein